MASPEIHQLLWFPFGNPQHGWEPPSLLLAPASLVAKKQFALPALGSMATFAYSICPSGAVLPICLTTATSGYPYSNFATLEDLVDAFSGVMMAT